MLGNARAVPNPENISLRSQEKVATLVIPASWGNCLVCPHSGIVKANNDLNLKCCGSERPCAEFRCNRCIFGRSHHDLAEEGETVTGIEMRELVVIACVKCGVPDLAAKIAMRWNRRFIARMGDARWFAGKDRGVIRLSAPLWPKASLEEKVETIIHETCHIIADFRFGPFQGHGPNWRALMRQCGYVNATRCHSVNREEIVERRQAREVYRVACGCADGAMLGRVQFQRLRKGTTYVCRRCRQSVRLP
jgi:predicted SprT family Zn-dependent metalloprotease